MHTEGAGVFSLSPLFSYSLKFGVEPCFDALTHGERGAFLTGSLLILFDSVPPFFYLL